MSPGWPKEKEKGTAIQVLPAVTNDFLFHILSIVGVELVTGLIH